ncbi:MAG: SDR family NAD(P)-dependent oxidoreductase [Trichodesmium sp. MAG_R02]|jgi:short-subunit dehydrogenase|nr:SDR family NAD(P)-dependent oxidoreductase [Trichodesmium sp. MAG_R02]
MSKKYLVITGGSRGIGLAIAKLFLEKRFQVINLSRNLCPLTDVVNIQMDLATKGCEENLKKEVGNPRQKTEGSASVRLLPK